MFKTFRIFIARAVRRKRPSLKMSSFVVVVVVVVVAVVVLA